MPAAPRPTPEARMPRMPGPALARPGLRAPEHRIKRIRRAGRPADYGDRDSQAGSQAFSNAAAAQPGGKGAGDICLPPVIRLPRRS